SEDMQGSDDAAELGPNYRVPALERGLDVLECMAAQGIPLTQSQLARALGRGPSELFRTLMTLERRGYIQRDPVSSAYGLTLRLYELSHMHSPFEELVRAAARPMRELADELRESPHLSVVHHGRLLVLAQAESSALVRISVAVGGTFPLLHTVSGRLLLAYLEPEQREATLQLVDEYAAWAPAQQAQLSQQLARIRAQGYEHAYGETNYGVSDLAVLVGAATSRTHAALTIPALARHTESFVESTLPALHRYAGAIGRTAGIVI
ncbi:MAG: IclR family transcriptional regulator, partial [Roseiflexaceae bacterium]